MNWLSIFREPEGSIGLECKMIQPAGGLTCNDGSRRKREIERGKEREKEREREGERRRERSWLSAVAALLSGG